MKLSTGDVWVLASTPLTEETKATIDKLGPVKWWDEFETSPVISGLTNVWTL